MNLWRSLAADGEADSADAADQAARARESGRRPQFVPRVDVALEVAYVVARVVLDARLSFLAAVAVAVLVPGRTGDAITALLVAIGSLLVYRAHSLRRVAENLRWLAWADLNKPLMRRLSLEAPGTYAHTIAMANLAEAACNAIGADGLLARAGAYYHDIGKLRKPQHFVENQPRGRNPHDKLKPFTSAAIIRGHVKDGLDLAREYGVPAPIRVFIAEHHGTLPIAFFLEKARERDGQVNATDYAYLGPIPQTAETAVCMLADSAEATVRSMHDPLPAAIHDAIDAMIKRRFEEGQLNEAPLTLRQIGIVRDQFVRILTGMYHGRVEYPTADGRTLAISPGSRASA